MKRLFCLFLTLTVLLSVSTLFAGCDSGGDDDESLGGDTVIDTSNEENTGNETKSLNTEANTDANTEAEITEYIFDDLYSIGTSGKMYASYKDGDMVSEDSDMYIVIDTSADGEYSLTASHTTTDGQNVSAEIWNSKDGINTDGCITAGVRCGYEGEYTNAISVWIYFLEIPDDFGTEIRFSGTDNGDEIENFATYNILGEAGANVSGVYFKTTSTDKNLTVGDQIIVMFDMSLSQMYGLKATYNDEAGAACYCNIVCFGESYVDVPFDGTADHQYFEQYGVYQEDADRLGLDCELIEGEEWTKVIFTVREIVQSTFTFYGVVDANETYGWITYDFY